MNRILLYQDSTAQSEMFLAGQPSGDVLEVKTLTLPSAGGAAEEFHLPAGTVIPNSHLQASNGDYLLVQVDSALIVEVPLAASTGDFSMFGGKFSGNAGYAISLRIHLSPKGLALPDAWFSLHVCGTLDAKGGGGGGTAFIEAAICCELRIPALPLPGTFPLPRLRIALPDLGLELPDFELPSVAFPRLPAFPWNFGWPAIELPSLFLKLSWRSLCFSHANGTILDITGLRLDGPGGRVIEADVHLVIQSGTISTDSYIDIYEKSGKTRLQIKHWYHSETCLAIGWTGKQLEAWLGLLLPELLTPNLPDDCDIVLRLLRDPSGLREARLDYVPAADKGCDIDLPGFKVSFAKPRFYSLVLWPQTPEAEEENWRLALLAAMSTTSVIKGHTTFALANENENERKLHNDEDPKSSEFLTLTASAPAEGLALVVCDLPMPGALGRAQFFQRVSDGVATIDWADPETLELPGVTALLPLKGADVNIAFDINLGGLPFLRRNGEDSLKQYIEILPGKGDVNFETSQFTLPLEVVIHLGAKLGLDLSSKGEVAFNWERFALDADGFKTISFGLKETKSTEFLGMTWSFEDSPTGYLFALDFSDGNIALRQAKGAKITASFSRLTSEPLVFSVENFVLGPRGLSVDARMERCQAKLNGVGTTFQFNDAALQMRDNRISGFTISGSGALPPDLVGDAQASVALQFGQNEAGNLELLSAGATLTGSTLLRCQSTRFELKIDGIGLRFVNENGDYHLYFALSGVAKFKPLDGDDKEGPLAWLPKIEIQFVDCPLAGDASVLKKHLRFNVELPKKVSFTFLGCFTFELRGFAFMPEVDFWDDRPASMRLCGQIKFAVDGGDVVDARFDFHDLYIALPESGSFLPRLRCRNLGLKLRVGESFELEGLLDFIDGEEVEPGWRARGFRGQGGITIMGLPKFHATFAFLRVLQPVPEPHWVRAWFIYTKVRHLSLQIPAPVPLFLREVGLGFGYRYTLAAIKTADEQDDIRKLIRELDKLALSQGELSDFKAWRLDVENPPEHPRWTLVMRGMLAMASSSTGATDWHPKKEKDLPNILLMDAVMGLRSDFTFFMNIRSWLFTNYRDYDDDVNGVRTGPLLFGYALFQPRKKRLLAHAASSDNPKFGDHPPLWGFMKQAIQSTRYSATLLIEPGLFHTELGWPNMLRWDMKWGPFQVGCRGGALFRVSRREMVQGLSFEARGSLSLRAEFGAGPVGARLWAEAKVGFGARYIFVLGLDRLDRTAFYGAVGLELSVKVGIELWIRIKIGFCKFTLSFSFSFELSFTALLEVGAQLTHLPGCRGTADVCLRLMGRGLHFHVHVGINESTVDRALNITKPFLNVGLEAAEVEPLPGASGSQQKLSGDTGAGIAPFAKAMSSDLVQAETRNFTLPHYDVVSVPLESKDGSVEKWFLALVPSSRADDKSIEGFVAIPPKDDTSRSEDYEWDFQGMNLSGKLAHIDMEKGSDPVQGSVHKWTVHWQQKVGNTRLEDGSGELPRTLRHLLRHAYIPANPDVAVKEEYNLGDLDPLKDPASMEPDRKGEAIRDPRVRHSADQNYEAAVRGALDQFEGSPYLKHDAGLEFEQKLRQACRNGESIYPADPKSETGEDPWIRAATELRSTVINGIIEDVRNYAQLVSQGADPKKLSGFREKSVAFGLGLIFELNCEKGEEPDWMKSGANPQVLLGTIRQPKDQDSTRADGDQRSVRAYNTRNTSFLHNPPRFEEARHVASASTVAIAWDLKWDVDEVKPEEHLRFYKVVRRPLGFDGAQREFQVKPAELLLREPDPRDSARDHIVAIPGRYPFVDHFSEESEDDIVALPLAGRSYLYTITPVDLAGQASPRSFSVVATRRPNRAPNAPQNPSLKIAYELKCVEDFKRQTQTIPLRPGTILVEVLEPPAPDDATYVPARSWRLVLRRERTLPLGSYPADSASDSPRQAAAASFARLLSSDVVVPLKGGKREPRDDGLHVVWNVPVGDFLRETFPDSGAADWTPAAWRVLIQAGTGVEADQANVWSSLAPVQLNLVFSHDGASTAYHPELLESVVRPLQLDFLRPAEGQAESSFASVPRPFVDRENPGKHVSFDLNDDSTKVGLTHQSVAYSAHPKRLRVARLRWNHTAAESQPETRELAAGYRLFEFDVDERSSGELQRPGLNMRRFLELTREVRQVRLLPANQITLTPAENLAPDQWEAWYPNSARREYLRAQDGGLNSHQGRGEDQWISPWFSWRDSFLEWPDMPAGWSELRLQGDTPASLGNCEVISSTVDGVVIGLPETAPEGVTAEEFNSRKQRLLNCKWFEFGDLPAVKDNVLRHVSVIEQTVGSQTVERLRFDAKQFNGNLPAEKSQLTIAQPRANAHWFLVNLITRVEAKANEKLGLTPESARFHGVQSDPCLMPPGKASHLEGFRAETSAGEDAYGWNLLKRMGLCAAVVFRNVRTGNPLAPEDVWAHLRETLKDVKSDSTPEIKALLGHLHVELLFQPGRSVRMDKDPDAKPDESSDLLALVQMSLRPRIHQSMVYKRYSCTGSEDANVGAVKLTISAPKATENGPLASPCHFIVEGENQVIGIKPGDIREVSCPLLEGKASVLIRHLGESSIPPTVLANGKPINPQDISPLAWEAVRFPDLRHCWYKDPSAAQNERDLEPEAPGAHAQWIQLKNYLRAAGVSEPPRDGSQTEDGVADAPFYKELNTPESLNWLRRMFNFSEDFTGCNNANPTNGDGPWLATAYPQANAQLYATPRNGRLEVAQIIDDAWAHAYRYFALPVSRYDQLWLGLAQSAELFPNINQRHENLESLLGLDDSIRMDPNDGGLDVSLPRIRRVAPPLVLASSRLDNLTPVINGESSDPSTRQPGSVWEVVLAKHSEQRLSERNRMLAQSLEFQHIAWSMSRRYAFYTAWDLLLKDVKPEAGTGDDWNVTDIAPVQNELTGPLPKLPDGPDWIKIPEKISEVNDENRALLLADRLDTLEQDAVALQWRHLPFFYEHQLSLIAQAGHSVSPVVTVTQRDFGFESPESVEITDSRISTMKDSSIPTKNDGPVLVVDVRLARVWDCLPKIGQNQWGIENPELSQAGTILPAALPDPEVVYELINTAGKEEPMPVRDVIATLALQETANNVAWESSSPSPRFYANLIGTFKPGKVSAGKDRWRARLSIKSKAIPPPLTQSISSRHDFASADLKSSGAEALPAERVELHWHGSMDTMQADVLQDWANRTDPSFAAALRALIARASDGQVITVEASAGLDQLIELDAGWKTRVTLGSDTLEWTGGLSFEDEEKIKAWRANTPFKSTLDALLLAAKAEQRASLDSQPTQPINPPLPKNVSLVGSELVKAADTLLMADGIKTLQEDHATWPADLKKAAKALAELLLSPIEIKIEDPSWGPRPTHADVQHEGLEGKLLIARGLLRVTNPLTHEQANHLLKQCNTDPQRQTIRALYQLGVKALLGGGSLSVRSRRSTATATPPVPVSFLPL